MTNEAGHKVKVSTLGPAVEGGGDWGRKKKMGQGNAKSGKEYRRGNIREKIAKVLLRAILAGGTRLRNCGKSIKKETEKKNRSKYFRGTTRNRGLGGSDPAGLMPPKEGQQKGGKKGRGHRGRRGRVGTGEKFRKIFSFEIREKRGPKAVEKALGERTGNIRRGTIGERTAEGGSVRIRIRGYCRVEKTQDSLWSTLKKRKYNWRGGRWFFSGESRGQPGGATLGVTICRVREVTGGKNGVGDL